MNLKRKLKRQKGSALISALIIVMVITSTISIWIHQSQLQIKKLHFKEENQQALWLTQGASIWAASTLNRKSFHHTSQVIANLDNGELKIPDGWKMRAKLIDAQSMFNINNVNERAMQLMFFLILQQQLKGISTENLKTIYYATIQRVEPSMAPKKTSEKPEDIQVEPLAQPLSSLSEWRQVAGVTPKVYQAMLPFLTVLPETTPININTCDNKLLATLKPGLKKIDVKKLIFAKGEDGFHKSDDLFSVLQDLKLPVQNITINSQYFWLEIEIQTPNHRVLKYQHLLYRRMTPKGHAPYIVLLKQSQLH